MNTWDYGKQEYSCKDRVLNLDPSIIFSRCTINRYKRHQDIRGVYLFPRQDLNTCICGCGNPPIFRYNTYASKDCYDFCDAVSGIISGKPFYLREWLHIKFPQWECCKCGSRMKVQIDHIIPVAKGGGGCWLDNYQLLCKKCHKAKTLTDKITRK